MRTHSWHSAESPHGWEIATKPVACLNRRYGEPASLAISTGWVRRQYNLDSCRSATAESSKEGGFSSKLSRMPGVVMTRVKPLRPCRHLGTHGSYWISRKPHENIIRRLSC